MDRISKIIITLAIISAVIAIILIALYPPEINWESSKNTNEDDDYDPYIDPSNPLCPWSPSNPSNPANPNNPIYWD